MFIVKKQIKGKDYFYLRKSQRVDGKVVAKTVAYLGKTRDDAEKRMGEIIGKSEERSVEQKVNKEKPQNNKMEQEKELSIDVLMNFCKRKGFVFRSSDIYGGFSGFWDFGSLGVELFNNLKKNWWDFFVQQKDNMIGMEASIISHPKTWKASGHIENFNVNDYLVTCKKCKKSSKIDKPDLKNVKCGCGGDYDWETAQIVEQMFKTKVGAADKVDVYLRGETAQGMFMDFKLIQQTSRMQLPFGIAQIGRCFRNEIAPRDFLFRSREFHIGEFEFFIHPEEKKCKLLDRKHLNVNLKLLDSETQKRNKDDLKDTTINKMLASKKLGEWQAYWLAEQVMWFNSLGLNEIKIREHTKDELSHYSSATFDIDYQYPFGSKEVAGNANRGQFDLMQHQKESKESMEIFDEKTKKKILPRVIEPTFGMERVFLAVLTKAYNYDSERGNVVLKLNPKLSPIKAAIFPLVKNDVKLVKIACDVYDDLKKDWNVVYDEGGSVGRRYARADEVGTPFCVTIDSDSIKGKDVTIRDRDTTKQIRVKISELKDVFRKLINSEMKFKESGKVVETRKKEE